MDSGEKNAVPGHGYGRPQCRRGEGSGFGGNRAIGLSQRHAEGIYD